MTKSIATFTPLSRSGPLPFVLDHSSHLRVAVKIQGITASAIIDSGAGRAVLDQTFAHRHAVALRKGFNVAGITGNAKGDFADNLNVKLGEISVGDLSAGVLDLNPYHADGEPRVDLIIGRELFSAMTVQIDFEAKTINFSNGATEHSALGFALPVEEGARGTPYITIEVDGHAVPVAFDLGYNAALLLSPEFVSQTDLLKNRRTSTVASLGVEGIAISRIATLSALDIGPVHIRDVPFEMPAHWNRPRPGVLGLDILKRFRITTDYPRGRIWFAPYPTRENTPMAKDKSGIGAVPTSAGLSIIHVAEGSPAQTIGLKPGDKIVKIDGEAVDAHYIISHPRMGTRPPGTTFVLELSDGRRLTMTLADYY